MDNLLIDIQDSLFVITFNRVNKQNAFDDHFLGELLQHLNQAINNAKIRVIILKANGQHFSAGADLSWMHRMAQYSEAENMKDAMVLAHVMSTLNQSPKPTIAMVHGAAFGGGAGIAAACDIAIASTTARFCFSEVKLGLIPAVISPYVVKAIGERSANALFMSGEPFDATRALALHLIHQVVPEQELLSFTLNYAQQISRNAPLAVKEAKELVQQVVNKPIDEALIRYTAKRIAQKRVSAEGQQGLRAFLNKQQPHWN